MTTYIYIIFFLVLLFIVFFIRADIKGHKRLPVLLPAIFFFLVLVSVTALNERNINDKLIEIYNSNDEAHEDRAKLSEYDKKRNKYEMNIISSSEWNKNIIDPIESGNLKLAAGVLKKAIIRKGMSSELKDSIMELRKNPEKCIGTPFIGEAEFIDYKLLNKGDKITKLLGDEKVAIYFNLSTENAVLYLNNDNNRVYDGMSEIQGIFVGVAKINNKDVLVFAGR